MPQLPFISLMENIPDINRHCGYLKLFFSADAFPLKMCTFIFPALHNFLSLVLKSILEKATRTSPQFICNCLDLECPTKVSFLQADWIMVVLNSLVN